MSAKTHITAKLWSWKPIVPAASGCGPEIKWYFFLLVLLQLKWMWRTACAHGRSAALKPPHDFQKHTFKESNPAFIGSGHREQWKATQTRLGGVNSGLEGAPSPPCHHPTPPEAKLWYCESKIRSTHCACKADVNRDGKARVDSLLHCPPQGSRPLALPSCSWIAVRSTAQATCQHGEPNNHCAEQTKKPTKERGC